MEHSDGMSGYMRALQDFFTFEARTRAALKDPTTILKQCTEALKKAGMSGLDNLFTECEKGTAKVNSTFMFNPGSTMYQLSNRLYLGDQWV